MSSLTERAVVIGSRSGLHARPAALFVQAAARQPVRVTIARDGDSPVDARSMLSVLALGARQGDRVVLAAEGEGAEEAVAELAGLLASDLDENPAGTSDAPAPANATAATATTAAPAGDEGTGR